MPDLVDCPACAATGFRPTGDYSRSNPAGVCLRCKGDGTLVGPVVDQLDALHAAIGTPPPTDPPYRNADDRPHVRFDHTAYTHEHGHRHRTTCKCGATGPWRKGTEPIDSDWQTLHHALGQPKGDTND